MSWNPLVIIKDKFNELVIEKVTKGAINYFRDGIRRLRGYRAVYGFVVLVFQIASVVITDPQAQGVISILMNAMLETGEGLANGDLTTVATPQDLTIGINAFYVLYGLILKIIKVIFQKPQVPFELKKKES